MSRLMTRLALLCVYRLGPQDLPYSRRVLVQLMLALALLQLVASQMLGQQDAALLRLLMMFAFMLLPIHLLLALRGHPERFVQTAIGFAGAGLLFSLAMLPLVLSLADLAASQVEKQQISGLQALAAWLMIGLAAWKLAVDTHLWRHALQWPMPAALALSLALFVLELVVARQFGAA